MLELHCAIQGTIKEQAAFRYLLYLILGINALWINHVLVATHVLTRGCMDALFSHLFCYVGLHYAYKR